MSQNTLVRGFVIPSGSAVGILAIDPSRWLQTLLIPAGMQGATFTVELNAEYNANTASGGVWYPMWNTGSASVAAQLYTINYTAGIAIRIAPADFYGCSAIRFTSNTVQSSSRNIGAIIGVVTG